MADGTWLALIVRPDVIPVLLMTAAVLFLTALTVRQGRKDRVRRDEVQDR